MSDEKHVVKLLEGRRVYLRPPETADVPLLYRSFYQPEVRRLTGTTHMLSIEGIQNWLEKVVKDEGRLFLFIVDQENDKVIGDIELSDMHRVHRSAWIRIALHQEGYFGKGYGSEAMHLMLNHGFHSLNLHRIELEVYDYNHRAIHTYEKLGFRREGVRREGLFHHQAYHDVILMGLLAHEYEFPGEKKDHQK